MKAQTYHVGDGKRACKKHEGVVEKKTELEQKARLQKEALEREGERQKDMRDRLEADQFSRQNSCWLCHRKAITEQEWAAKLLIAHERMDIKHVKTNLFSPDYVTDVRRELGLNGDDKLLVTSFFPVLGNEDRIKKLPSQVQAMASIAGCISICQDCAKNLGVKKELPKPNLTLKQLMTFGAIYDVVTKPIVREVAKEELRQEGERN